ncbi:hypothetical protein MGN70_012391 [Eutypa lata]|uniref:Histone chaperone domain-containing protein n=1 Tax=Eutypa lata (strain UCR-EL1) TaxID=1287681 RepID=M7SQQ5_EUTLA|nr:hypothetical protein UCREL1_4185 [Eutypa lata UCREL1]KAI1245501.1 hypothetical protein MGN70_012391 [Eutypa lata]
MATENGTTVPNQDPTKVTEPVESKGKGKAVAEDPADVSMDDDEEDSDEEAGDGDDNEEDGLEEIDLSNIVEGGRRTRGRVIDWAKAAEENPAEDDDDDEDDFEPEKEEEDDKMDES